MKNLSIDEQKLKDLYSSVCPEFQKKLLTTFGQEIFVTDIKDRIKTFEDACAVYGILPQSVFSLSDTPDEIAYKKLKIITRALNEDWVANWTDNKERKYYPYFEFVPGVGFRFFVYDFWIPCTIVGSRLCYKNWELAKYSAEQFRELWNDFLTIK